MSRENDFSRLELRLPACRSNFRYFRGRLRPSTKLLVLVKANAYGHGAVEFATILQQEGADYLTPARAWAGDIFQRKMWICDIAQRTGRAADLVVLAREAQAACSGVNANFGNICRVAGFFKAASNRPVSLAPRPHQASSLSAKYPKTHGLSTSSPQMSAMRHSHHALKSG